MDLEKASEMWKANASMGQIAAELGLNRNQVAGKIGRNRDMFPRRGSPVPAKKKSANAIRKLFDEEQKKSGKEYQIARYHHMVNGAEIPALDQPVPKPKESAQAYDQSRLPGYTLWELDARGCKYPLLETQKGETQRFCGETRYQMKPWCKAHHERVWRAQ